ncbi:DMT family transporter [Microvirga massiliensis]|uniref:DMT family transporter n=1 Tax=Microvirga massiliensis TaxID=1033741 RepID=UPI00062BC49F|nr:DMT family transporter [Microvirga massiliensis]
MLLARLAPPLFVVIWATGFVVARAVVPHSDPWTFLVLRYALAISALSVFAFLVRAPWPRGSMEWFNALVAGILLHGFYLGGVFFAVKHGLPAGIAALISSLQPLATGVLVGPLLGERVTPRRWVGIAVGLTGAILVVLPGLLAAEGFTIFPVFACLIAMLSITLGTIWQKRTGGGGDLRTQTVVQYLGAIAITLPAALLVEEGRFDLVFPAIAGLLWAVFGLSIGAIGLLLYLIRRGAVAGIATLLYLVPPVSALMAFFLFGETLTLIQISGMAVAALGVAVANRPDQVTTNRGSTAAR